MASKSSIVTIAFVRWLDASHQHGPIDESDMPIPRRRVLVDSAGVIVGEDRKTISLALDAFPVESSFRHVNHIPKDMCVQIRRFRVRKVRNPAVYRP